MKLIDLLVKELPKRGGWPEFASICWCDPDGEIRFDDDTDRDFYPSPDFVNKDDRAWRVGNASNVVTRDQYDFAIAASEGWIEWGGGKHPPVSTNTVVDVKLEKGYVQSGYPAGEYSWEHVWQGSNIIAYRLHKPDINSHANDDRLEQDLNECIGHGVDVVNHPSHYTKGRIECIDAIDSATTGKSGVEAVCVANVIKYLWRYEEKNGLEDVKKAKWYLNKLISEMESK